MTEPNTEETRASQEATDWFLLLEEEPADADLRARFEAWRSADPRNVSAWAVTQRTAGLMAQVPPVNSTDMVQLAAQKNVPPFAGRRGRWAVGSALALAACLGLLFLQPLLLRLQADFTTSTAEIRIERLEDGSTLTLAPESAVRIAYTGLERRIELLSGEAFFEVSDPKGRPFRVIANGIETTDLGTTFSVRRINDGTAIAVASGSVRVDYRASAKPISEVLEAGQAIRIARTGDAMISSQPPMQIASWRQRQLIAQDEPMRDVVEQLRPHFEGKIILAGAELAGRRVTGVYNIADPVNALRGIAQARDAVVRQVTPWLLIVSVD